MRAWRLVAVVAAVLLALVACGDGRLSTSQFDAKGNAICTKANAQVAARRATTFPKNGLPPAKSLAAFYTSTLIPSIKSQVAQLRKLKPPKKLEADVKTALDDADGAIAEVEAAASDPPTLEARINDAFTKVTAELKTLGLNACAGG